MNYVSHVIYCVVFKTYQGFNCFVCSLIYLSIYPSIHSPTRITL